MKAIKKILLPAVFLFIITLSFLVVFASPSHEYSNAQIEELCRRNFKYISKSYLGSLPVPFSVKYSPWSLLRHGFSNQENKAIGLTGDDEYELEFKDEKFILRTNS